jgi:biotin carboxylase
MAHLLFVDANEPGIATLGIAKDLGHRVTFVRSTEHVLFHETPAALATLARLDRIVDVGLASDPEQLIKAVGEVVATDPVDQVITQSGFCVAAAAQMAAALRLPFTDPGAVLAARNKATSRRLLREHGLPSARYALIHHPGEAEGAAAEVGFPIVVKPAGGENSMLAYRVDDIDELRTIVAGVFADIDGLAPLMRDQFSLGVLIEQHLAGELVSAEIGRLNGVSYRYMVSGRIRARHNECVEMGALMPAPLSPADRDACFTYGEQVCAALGLDLGIFHLEMIMTEAGPVLVEANPRLMGGVMPSLYRNVTGHEIQGDLVRIHTGQPPEPPPPPRRLVTSRKIMSWSAATLTDRIDLGWLAGYGDSVVAFDDYGIRPGRTVGEQQVLGRVQVTGPTLAAATEHADRIVERMAQSLGIALIH